jgi:hypothetical protein
MASVAIYHKSIPPGNKSVEKPLILTNFSQGVRRNGDLVVDVQGHDVVITDVGVIQGWVHSIADSAHLKLRRKVIMSHRKTVCADSNLFLYKDKTNPGNYLRYSFNGIFPTTGIYCDNQIDTARWQKIQRDLGLAVKDYRISGEHILLCLQRNGGWSMAGLDVVAWTLNTINTLRQHTNRPIVIRVHPGDKSSKDYIKQLQGLENVTVSESGKTMEQDLINCWAVVNYNSSSVVGASIEGYPVFVTDSARSQCRDIANTDLSQIETPVLHNRQPWLERIAMFHWNFQELASGACWAHMRKWINK